MSLILLEGAKNVGKTTNFKPKKIQKRDIHRFKKYAKNKDIFIDRMFLKEHVYTNAPLHNTLCSVSYFDKIVIVLPTNLDEYINNIIERMIMDVSFQYKMVKTYRLFTELNALKCTFEKFLIMQIKNYYKFMIQIQQNSIFDLESIKKEKTNIDIKVFSFNRVI